MLTISEDLLRVSCKLFYLWFCVSTDHVKTLYSKEYGKEYCQFEKHFYLRITCNLDEISSWNKTRPGMKKILCTRAFHPGMNQ